MSDSDGRDHRPGHRQPHISAFDAEPVLPWASATRHPTDPRPAEGPSSFSKLHSIGRVRVLIHVSAREAAVGGERKSWVHE